jgi:glyoxylase-like metal-dependent hydrolase (beta-lactamase superfamily II)
MIGTWHYQNERIGVRKAEVGTFGNNTYVVACLQSSASIIVDAAAEADRVIELTAGTNPVAVITTHGHADHVGAATDVASRLEIPVRLHRSDWDICPVRPDEPLEPGPLRVGDSSMDVLHTPGHTPGSIVLVTSGAVITGDTLFPGGPGATRFPYSDFDQVMDSLESKIFLLPDETIVMPGHGLDTTLGAERPALPEWRERRW